MRNAIKTLPLVVVAMLFVATSAPRSQPAVYGQDKTVSNVVPNSLRIFHANGENVKDEFLLERQIASKNDLRAHEKQVHSTKAIFSNGWVLTFTFAQIWSDSG
jgi:hypothetical protein